MSKFSLPQRNAISPIPTPEEAYNSVLLGTKINNDSEKIIEINIDLLDEIDNQPFRINQNKVEQYAESIKEIGLLEPIQVRAKNNGRYEILAGRHRVRAHKLLGLNKIKSVKIKIYYSVILTLGVGIISSLFFYFFGEKLCLLVSLKHPKKLPSFST